MRMAYAPNAEAGLAPPPSIEALLAGSFLILDKPAGPSTHEVVAQLRKLFGVKAGQMGTLDPQVSGVVVVGLGRAVRLLRFIDSGEKVYIGVLGLKNPPSTLAQAQAAFDRHVGLITQVPPRESAVAKRARARKVYEFRALEVIQHNILFVARVQAGTYIRVLCQSVGKSFGGGQMRQLRRIRAGRFDESQAARLPDVVDALWQFRKRGVSAPLRKILRPASEMIDRPRIALSGAAAESVCRGAPLAISGVAADEAAVRDGCEVALTDVVGNVLAIARRDGMVLRPFAVVGTPSQK